MPTLYWEKLGSMTSYAIIFSGIWNAWHFGSQNFGIAQIYRRLWRWPERRRLDKMVCIGLAFTALIPIARFLGIFQIAYPHWLVIQTNPPLWLFFLIIGTFNVNHWLTSLGLSTKVMPQWWWPGVLVLLGASAFLWAWPLGGGPYRGLTALVYLNFGVGFAHYWVDGLIWKRGSPVMKAVLA
jgi:hypothetical protein